MTSIQLRISTAAGNIRYLKKWEELNPSDTFSAAERGDVGQFSFYTPYILDAAGNWCGTWSSNANHSTLTRGDEDKIIALQIPDEYSVKQKMGWLCWMDQWGAPQRSLGAEWDTAGTIQQIAAVYANQAVEILERRVFNVTFNGVFEAIPMSRFRTFSRADFGVTHQTHPHLIHKVTVVDRGNRYGERPKGIVYLPVSLGLDFDFVGSFKPASWWLFDRWLKDTPT